MAKALLAPEAGTVDGAGGPWAEVVPTDPPGAEVGPGAGVVALG